jgi:general secretion pathway protein K
MTRAKNHRSLMRALQCCQWRARNRDRKGAAGRRGSALLAVLWLSAALSAIAYSVATSVRGEIERTSTLTDGVQSYFLATGALERALFYIELGPAHRNPDGTPRFFDAGTPRLNFTFGSGVATVEIIPEASKLSINESRPEDLARLMMHLGAEPERAQQIAMAIVDWRSPAPGGLSMFDHHYLSLAPSFRARHSSLEEIEELLLVKGMTPDLFYGSVVRDEQGRLQPRAGLRDCVSVYGSAGAVDVNTAQPAVMAAFGIPPEAVAAIVQRRHALPFRTAEQLAAFTQGGGPAFSRLTVGGGTIYTLRSTGRLRSPNGNLLDMTRTVSGLVKFHRVAHNPPIQILRWYDN